MSNVYRSRHGSYRPVRVRSFCSSIPGLTPIAVVLGALSILDGAIFVILGLR